MFYVSRAWHKLCFSAEFLASRISHVGVEGASDETGSIYD